MSKKSKFFLKNLEIFEGFYSIIWNIGFRGDTKVKKTKKWLIYLFPMFLLIGGCSNEPTVAEQVYTKLEEVVTLEATFKEQQEPLVELEKDEKKIYDEIISLSMKEYDKIVTLSNEALTLVDERLSRIETEHESITEAKEQFETVVPIIEQFEEEKLKVEASKVVEIMNRRYEAYEQLYTNYKNAISLDKELYELFQKEDLSLDVLENHIKEINDSYDKVLNSNTEFNQLTEEYNKAKVKLYEESGLNVVYEEDESDSQEQAKD